MTMEHST